MVHCFSQSVQNGTAILLCRYQLFALGINGNLSDSRCILLYCRNYESSYLTIVRRFLRRDYDFDAITVCLVPSPICFTFIEGMVSCCYRIFFSDHSLISLQYIAFRCCYLFQCISSHRKRCRCIHIDVTRGLSLCNLSCHIRIILCSDHFTLTGLYDQITVLALVSSFLSRSPFCAAIIKPRTLCIVNHIACSGLQYHFVTIGILFPNPNQGRNRLIHGNHQVIQRLPLAVAFHLAIFVITSYIEHKRSGCNMILRRCRLYHQIPAIGQLRCRHHTTAIADQLRHQIGMVAICLVCHAVRIGYGFCKPSIRNIFTACVCVHGSRSLLAHSVKIQCGRISEVIYNSLGQLRVRQCCVFTICQL